MVPSESSLFLWAFLCDPGGPASIRTARSSGSHRGLFYTCQRPRVKLCSLSTVRAVNETVPRGPDQVLAQSQVWAIRSCKCPNTEKPEASLRQQHSSVGEPEDLVPRPEDEKCFPKSFFPYQSQSLDGPAQREGTYSFRRVRSQATDWEKNICERCF